jgi:hypothetical protein
MPLTSTLVSSTALGSSPSALTTPCLAKRAVDCLGHGLPELAYFSLERFNPLKQSIELDGAATGHRDILCSLAYHVARRASPMRPRRVE